MLKPLRLLFAMVLLFSCSRTAEHVAPGPDKDGAAWQKGQWDRCAQTLQRHLDPQVRGREMRTLDAAYVALLSTPAPETPAYVLPFTTDGTPCEARVERSGRQAAVTVFRENTEVGTFTMDDNLFTGSATGISFTAAPFSASGTEVHAKLVVTAEAGTLATLATLQADGPPDLITVQLSLPEGIALMGTVEARRLGTLLEAVADDGTQEGVTALVKEADSTLHVNVYYEDNLAAPHARVSLRPLHLVSRYDNYWTWEAVILTSAGQNLEEAWQAMGGLDNATVTFIQAWRHLMPHLLS